MPVLGDNVDYAEAVAIQPDGKILVAGISSASDGARGGPGFGVTRQNADGTPDATFGVSGQVWVPVGTGARAVAVAPDGKIVVASEGFTFVRLNRDGSLDASFGKGGGDGDGVYTSTFGNAERDLRALVVREDGRILAAGRYEVTHGNGQFLFVQLTADGTPDGSFGDPAAKPEGGEAGQAVIAPSVWDDDARALHLLGDGSVLAAGLVHGEFGMVRLRPDGRLDTATFGRRGVVLTPLGPAASQARAIAVMPDGRIVLAGVWGGDVAMARYAANGALDTTFGSGGSVRLDLDGTDNDSVVGVFRTADGKLVVAGWYGPYDGNARLYAARFTAQGKLDNTYAGGGVARIDLTPAADVATGAAIRGDRLVIASSSNANYPVNDFLVTRLTAGGALDPTFSGDGKSSMNIRGPAAFTEGDSILLADGRILNVGQGAGFMEPNAFRVTRLNADGTVDTTFGPGGHRFLDWGMVIDVRLMRRPSDNKIVAAYAVQEGSLMNPRTRVFLARLNADGTVDASFGTGGRRGVGGAGLPINVAAATLDANQRIVLTGGGDRVARYNADGSLDRTFGANGVATLMFAGVSSFGAADLAVAPDGRIVLAGNVALLPNESGDRIGVVRLTSAGRVETTFGIGGLARITPPTGIREFARSVAVQPDGRILVAGRRYAPPGQSVTPLVMRVRADGLGLDASFGSGGRALVPIGATGGFNEIAIVGGGRIVALAGVRVNSRDADGDVAVVRLLNNGQVDPSFGAGGKTITDFEGEDHPATFLVQADGKVLISGRSAGGLFFARYGRDDLETVFANGTLTVTGTDGDDRIEFGRDWDGNLLIDGGAFNAVERIVVRGLGGNDVIDLRSLAGFSVLGGPVVISTTLDGGAGNDSILGGPGRDVIHGAAGDDTLEGLGGDDTLFGGGGNDSLRGGDANDYLNGGPGADRVLGDNGNDQIFALDGAVDTLDGGAGFDRVKRDANDVPSNAEGLLA